MDPEEIFNLFEGVCPVCGKEVHLTQAGGTLAFKREQVPSDFKGKFNVWGPSQYSDAVGNLTYECPEGHQSYVEQLRCGDWA